MFLLRVFGLLAVVSISASALLYLFTGERRYLRVALKIARYAIGAALLLFALLLAQRLLALV